MVINGNPTVLCSEIRNVLSPIGQKNAANNTDTKGLPSLVTHKGRRFSHRRISDIKRTCWNCVSRYGGML